ncbi:RagB/SusD family nutrient uptake outer membrane protein [Segatella buccae]|uniref:RagB/SusD family nutrient uptake outer membrane protein n=1 Tax=Segatella buccae TaxID=28126 RepID=UPI000E0E9D65|nr:RagB/SusD family nutrient uptake outer membrane protein [Segatella buccae]
MTTTIKNIVLSSAFLAVGLTFQACSLDEENPGGFTMEAMAKNSLESYQTLINQCYFGAERVLYGTDGFMELTEGDTDLWTHRRNQPGGNTQYFWFFAGAAPNTTYIDRIWNALYDGIGSCNMAISLAPKAPFKTENDRNAKVAIARFMRAVYFFNAVEQFGAVTMITDVPSGMDFSPTRTEPLEIYRKVILPDLEFAVAHLEKGDDATTTTPTKKAALGMLAKAYLQTKEYGTDEYIQKAYDTAKLLIDDCESGGSTYGAYMYPSVEDVFKEANNYRNKEALWKHRWYAGTEGHGSSNGNYRLNRNDEKFLANINYFGACEDNQATRLTWRGSQAGIFMPTQHLLSLYVQADGTLDPRFHQWFTTEWAGNKKFVWDATTAAVYGKDAGLAGQMLSAGDKAIEILMPQDADYQSELAKKSTAKYLVIDYKDIYNDASKNVVMTSGGKENILNNFYPSLNKHNSSNYYVANANKMRNANLNATFIMRMAEVYLIAAEADIYLGNTAEAKAFINKIRRRAGANELIETPTIRTILDERGRELCGEYCRFYDLKRTGMFKDAAYLQDTHPDLAVYFKPEYALRPISTTFTAGIINGAEYQNPGY